MYRSKKFSIRKDIDEIKKNIKRTGANYGNHLSKIYEEQLDIDTIGLIETNTKITRDLPFA